MKKAILTALCIAALILELLPYGAVLRFAVPNSTEELMLNTFRSESFYSYFDLTPYGYGNLGPLFTGILTVILSAVIAVYCMKNRGILAIRIVSALATFTSLLPLIMFGASYFTVIGGAITALLLAVLVISFVKVK